jgi:hypothetical protein
MIQHAADTSEKSHPTWALDLEGERGTEKALRLTMSPSSYIKGILKTNGNLTRGIHN